VTTWTVADLTDLLVRQGYRISPVAVNRTLHVTEYCCRRPRHDLPHRQDADAVAKHALQEAWIFTAMIQLMLHRLWPDDGFSDTLLGSLPFTRLVRDGQARRRSG
jgi:winged helix-turn-helix protein